MEGVERMAVIHPLYLPFEADQLRRHFAPTARGALQDPDRHLTYYLNSAGEALKLVQVEAGLDKVALARLTRLGIQMQKDERFWVVTALMRLFHSDDPVANLSRALSTAVAETPPITRFPTWNDALGDRAKLSLFFEVALPSPPSYKERLRTRLHERALVPWILEAAVNRPKKAVEGATKVDAMLMSADTGFAVAFEAKVLSDVSSHIEYDALRNQIARNVDVLLDANKGLPAPLSQRIPELTCFVLLTPRIFKDNPDSRLYGWLMNEYRSGTSLLQRHLDHRPSEQLETVPSRLGWLTWEDVNDIVPDACAWLDKHTQSGEARVSTES